MAIEATVAALLQGLEERGCSGRIVPFERLRDLRDELEGRRTQGQLSEAFYRERLKRFKFSPPGILEDARSVILVAVPQPQLQVAFRWNGQRFPLTISPTFLFGRETQSEVSRLINGVLAPEGYRLARAALPLKLLATRSGLAEYGRNNVCYVPGMGSFFYLAAFHSDLPCLQDPWQESKAMQRCQECSACLRACPSGAITSERFLLSAERCINFHKERLSDYPEWLDPAWHDCLVGCMHCQRACPQNRGFLDWVEPLGEFSERETAMLLKNVPLGALPVVTVQKLRRLDLVGLLDILPRDLEIFMRRSGQGPR